MLFDGIISLYLTVAKDISSPQARTKSALSPILKCSARSIRQIRYRPAAQQAPRNRIRANADNRKASRPSLFVLFHNDHRRDLHWDADHAYHFRERATVLLINIYRTPVSGVLRRKDSGFAVCGENLASVSQFVAGIRHGRSFKQEHDRARWVIGVGREGYWSGAERVTKMAEWPDWNPPEEMIVRQPYLPRFMAGGETNPLGARALYLGKTVSG